ncbi:MAG: hypothetical protein PVJ01_05065 [Pseudomonadota bacterium]
MNQRGTIYLILTFTVLAAASPGICSSALPASKTGQYASNLQYTGGSETGFTLEQIRWGDHHNFERVVLEFSSPMNADDRSLPRLKVETEYYPMRMAIRLPGSVGNSDLTAGPLFTKSKLISGMDIFEVCGGGQHLTLIPARPVEFEVFTLQAPPRLVIDVILSRMPPLREETKYSLRTLPLYGDQVCLFLEDAADAGITPRLITDGDGNVFGEISLFDEEDEAFKAADRLKDTLGRKFSLVVKARGMMTVPAVIP